MGAQFRAPLKLPYITALYCIEGFKGKPLIEPSLCRETLVARTADVSFSSLGVKELECTSMSNLFARDEKVRSVCRKPLWCAYLCVGDCPNKNRPRILFLYQSLEYSLETSIAQVNTLYKINTRVYFLYTEGVCIIFFCS